MRIIELMRNATVEDYRAALEGLVCPRMLRAWRNRTGTTKGLWLDAVYVVAGRHTEYAGIEAACLYVACGWCVEKNGGDAFYGSHPGHEDWKLIRNLTLDLMLAPSEKTMMPRVWAAWQRSRATLKRKRKP